MTFLLEAHTDNEMERIAKALELIEDMCLSGRNDPYGNRKLPNRIMKEKGGEVSVMV